MPEINTAETYAPDDMEQPGGASDGVPEAPAANASSDTAPATSAPDQPAVQQDMEPEQISGTPPVSAPELKTEMDAHRDDLDKGWIKPETMSDLYHNKSISGKIGTIFGLMIGGAGAGLTHQPNALLGMMQKELDNDLEAQKSSVTGRQNLYKLNLEHQMNLARIDQLQKAGKLNEAQAALAKQEAATKAYALTRAQMNNTELHKLVAYAQKLPPGSPDKLAADQNLALLSSVVKDENYSLADRAQAQAALVRLGLGGGFSGGNGQASNDPEQQFQNQLNMLKLSGNPTMVAYAKDLESRHLPGVPGLASNPVTDSDRAQYTASQDLLDSLNRLKEFSEKNPKPIKGSKADKEGKALAAIVQGKFRVATNGGVYKEGEQNFINQVIPSDPTSWSPFADVAGKIDTVANETRARRDLLLKNKGFPGSPADTSNIATKGDEHPEGTMASNPKTGQQWVRKNGKWVEIKGKGSAIGNVTPPSWEQGVQ